MREPFFYQTQILLFRTFTVFLQKQVFEFCSARNSAGFNLSKPNSLKSERVSPFLVRLFCAILNRFPFTIIFKYLFLLELLLNFSNHYVIRSIVIILSPDILNCFGACCITCSMFWLPLTGMLFGLKYTGKTLYHFSPLLKINRLCNPVQTSRFNIRNTIYICIPIYA